MNHDIIFVSTLLFLLLLGLGPYDFLLVLMLLLNSFFTLYWIVLLGSGLVFFAVILK